MRRKTWRGSDEDGEPSDEELFGKSTNKIIAKWLQNFANTMRNHPEEISGLGPEDGEEYDSDLEDIREEAKVLKQVAAAFERQGLMPGLIMWRDNSEDWWWERIAPEMEEETGISMDQLWDQNGLNENTEPSDEELFGDPIDKLDRVNWESIEIGGIDHRDHPDYTDAFVDYAESNK